MNTKQLQEDINKALVAMTEANEPINNESIASYLGVSKSQIESVILASYQSQESVNANDIAGVNEDTSTEPVSLEAIITTAFAQCTETIHAQVTNQIAQIQNQHQEKLEALNVQNSQLEKQVDEITHNQTDISELQQKLRDAEETIISYKSHKLELEEKNEALVSDLKMQAENQAASKDDLVKSEAELTEQLNSLTAALDEQKGESQKQEALIATLTTENNELAAEVTKASTALKGDSEQFSEQLESLTVTLKDTEQALADHISEAEELEEAIGLKEAELNQEKAKTASLIEDNNALNNNLDKSEQVLAQLREEKTAVEERLTATHQDANSNVSDLEQRLNTTLSEKEKTESAFDVYKQDAEAKVESLQQLIDQSAADSQAKSDELQAQISALKSQIETQLTQEKKLHAEIDTLTQSNFKNESEVKDANQQLAQMQKEAEEYFKTQQEAKKAIEQTAEGLETRLVEADKDKLQLVNHVADLERQLESLNTNNQSLLTEKADAQGVHQQEVAELNRSIESQSQQIAECQKTITDTNDEIVQLNNQISGLSETRNKQDNAIKQMTSSLESAKSDLAALEDSYKTQIEQLNTTLAMENAAVAQAHQDLELANETSQGELEVLTDELKQAQQKVTQITHELAGFKQSHEQLSQSLAHEQRRNENVNERIAEETDKARGTIKALRDENHQLHQDIDDLKHDWEAKVTEYRLKFEYAQKQLSQQS